MGIEKMDGLLAKMGNLKILNLSYNKLTYIPAQLPPKIQELNLTGNQISELNLG
jgi:Leucine-rich repeat (LRR) protein